MHPQLHGQDALVLADPTGAINSPFFLLVLS